MFNEPEEGGIQSCMGHGDWTHIGPLMHNFASPKKVKSVVFHVYRVRRELKDDSMDDFFVNLVSQARKKFKQIQGRTFIIMFE
jgi:hypothetical protein